MKKRASTHSTNNTSMLDILFNMLFFFFITTVLFACLIAVSKKTKNIDAKAEYLITVEWPKDFKDDVDTYCEDPSGNIIFYNQKAAGLMHLDRDDLGHANDIIITPYGTFKYNVNKEVVTLRGTLTGWYTLNIHLFNQEKLDRSVPVTVTIERLNPWGVSFVETLTLVDVGDEITVLRFRLDKDGDIVETNKLEKKFIGKAPQ
jgi:hypothetical protein